MVDNGSENYIKINMWIMPDNSGCLICSWVVMSWMAQRILMHLWFYLSESQVIDHLYNHTMNDSNSCIEAVTVVTKYDQSFKN